MSFPVRANLTIYAGSTYVHRFDLTDDGNPYPLVGFTANMHIREEIDDAATVYEATELDDIAIDGVAGTVTLTIPDETSTAWQFAKGVYDLEIEAITGERYRIAEGSVKVRPEVTR